MGSKDKFDFMSMVQDILDETPTNQLVSMGVQLKAIIDCEIGLELEYAKVGIRGKKESE